MRKMKHVLAIGVAALVAMASAVPLAEAGHGFGGGGFGGHGFGGARGFAVGPRGGFAFSGPRGGRAFVGPRGGAFVNRNFGHGHFVNNHRFNNRRFFAVGFFPGYYDYGYYGGGCSWLYRNAVATGSPYWWNRYQYCIGY